MVPRFGSVVLALAALLSCAVLMPTPASASGKTTASAVDAGVFADLNQIRVEHGLVPLTLSASLSAAAMAHTREMVAKGYFAHSSADGQPFWQRIEAYYPQGSFNYWSVGENLFWTSGSATAAAGMNAWMASPPHRANILDPVWRQIGIATLSATDAPGAYDGLSVTLITTDFGVRR